MAPEQEKLFPFCTYMFCIVFCTEFVFPSVSQNVIRIPKSVYYLPSTKASNLLYHLTEQKKTWNCHKQLSSYQTHTTFMHKPSTHSFSANLCRIHTFFSHLFRFYLFQPCLRILAFRHSLWFITIVPDTRRPLPKLCSFECCVPTVLSERKTDMMPSLPVYLCTPASPHAHIELLLYFFCTNLQQQASQKQFCVSLFK